MNETFEHSVPALVLGDGISALGALRALHRAKIPCLQFSFETGIEADSRYWRPLQTSSSEKTYGALPSILESSPLEKAVLIPASDHWAEALCDLQDSLAPRFLCATPPAETLACLLDKAQSAIAFETHKIPHPKTFVLHSPDDLGDLEDDWLDTFFIKPCDSQQFFAHFKQKAFDFTDIDDARARISECLGAGISVLLQEYVPGPPRNHIYVEGYRDGAGNIRALFARRRLRMYPARFGNSTAMQSIPLNEVQAAVESMKTLLAAISYRGIFSAEFKEDAHDGLFKLLEVNTRAWWYIEFVAACGVNTAELLYRDALDLPTQDLDENYTVGMRETYPYYDIHSPQVAANETSYLEVLATCLSARQTVFSLRDPRPSLCWFARRLRARLGGLQ